MGEKLLMKGNEVIAEAALRAGCRHYFGYPITPQTEISHYMAKKMPALNGTFVQAESEIAAINMVYGAASAGARAMTSSSSPGISLKQEGLSYIAGAELPAVIVNIVRCGPGLGGILPAQCDYFQAVKGGGHGDYRMLVYAPYNLQECRDLTMLALDKADEYRNPVMMLGDAVLGQMMEPLLETPYIKPELPPKTWALGNCSGRKPNVIMSLYMGEGDLEKRNYIFAAKYARMRETEVMCHEYLLDDAELVIVAYGVSARIALSAIKRLRSEGMKVGLFRPVTLFPFPERQIADLAGLNRRFLCVELNMGQMVEDVRLAVNGKAEVSFYGRPGGSLITPEELYDRIKQL